MIYYQALVLELLLKGYDCHFYKKVVSLLECHQEKSFAIYIIILVTFHKINVIKKL